MKRYVLSSNFNYSVLSRIAQSLEGSLTLKPIVHEIRIQNQVIFLDPPIEYARHTWIQQLHDWLGESFLHVSCEYILTVERSEGIVCRLRIIQSSRYEIGLQMQSAVVVDTTYTSLVRTSLYFALDTRLNNMVVDQVHGRYT